MNGLLNLETDNVRGPAQVNVQFVGPEMISLCETLTGIFSVAGFECRETEIVDQRDSLFVASLQFNLK